MHARATWIRAALPAAALLTACGLTACGHAAATAPRAKTASAARPAREAPPSPTRTVPEDTRIARAVEGELAVDPAVDASLIRVDVDDGVVEIAAVPAVVSGPVTALVRVSRGGRHVGFFGPFPVVPEAGQAWLAGRVILQGGRVAAVVAIDDVSVGSPF
jgi:hypothetical protein